MYQKEKPQSVLIGTWTNWLTDRQIDKRSELIYMISKRTFLSLRNFWDVQPHPLMQCWNLKNKSTFSSENF
jgi:hypothetical protein